METRIAPSDQADDQNRAGKHGHNLSASDPTEGIGSQLSDVVR
jgi:hypothetical protein